MSEQATATQVAERKIELHMTTPYTLDEMKANREKWIAELESGNWKQGRQNLRWQDTYCCWGVACKMAGFTDIKADDNLGFFDIHDGRASQSHGGNCLYEALGIQSSDAYELEHINDSSPSGNNFANVIGKLKTLHYYQVGRIIATSDGETYPPESPLS